MTDTRIPLLELTTLTERPVIDIDGVKYEIIHPNELSVIEQARFGRAGRKIDELQLKEGEEAEAELDQLIKATASKIAPDVPEEVWAKTTGAIRWAIVDLFTALSLRQKMTVAGAMAKAAGNLDSLFRGGLEPTGGKSSPSLSAFTAENPQPGWRNTLRALFGRTSG